MMWYLGLTFSLGATMVAGFQPGFHPGFHHPTSLGDIGPCTAVVRADSTANYEQFATDNGGFWPFAKGPSRSFITSTDWSHLHIRNTPFPRIWNSTMHYSKGGTSAILDVALNYDHYGGYITSYTTEGNYFKIYILYYVPGRLFYYYICSDEGGDYLTDYRYLLTHDQLTYQEQAYIAKLDQYFQFKDSLVDLPSLGPNDASYYSSSSSSGYCST